MTARRPSRMHRRNFKGYHILAVQRNKPTKRTNETKIQAAPTHTVRKSQTGHESFQDFRQKRLRSRALFMHHRINIAVLPDKRRRIDFLSARETLRRFRRIPVRVKSRLNRRTSTLTFDVRLTLGKAGHEKSRTARSAYRRNILVFKTKRRQSLRRVFRKFVENSRHRMCRNFFRSDFQKKIFAHAVFASFLFNIGYPSFSRCSK